MIKGVGVGNARQITALLQLAQSLTVPSHDQVEIHYPKDVYDLLAPELRHSPRDYLLAYF
jgi:DNA repair protein RadC